MHHNVKSSKRLQELREEPQTDIYLPDGGPVRNMIEKFNVPCGQGKSKSWESDGEVKTVYYLTGDERRAVRKFIEANSRFCKSCMGNSKRTNHPISHHLDDVMWWLFQQEYEIMEYNGEI